MVKEESETKMSSSDELRLLGDVNSEAMSRSLTVVDSEVKASKSYGTFSLIIIGFTDEIRNPHAKVVRMKILVNFVANVSLLKGNRML